MTYETQVSRKENVRLKIPILHLIFFTCFIFNTINLNYGFLDDLLNPDFYSPPEMIKRNGYPIEIYNVTTSDGYILDLQRIPHGKSNKNGSHFPILLIHGYIDSSFAWIANGPKRALAYLLADQGYDVWMINLRGNTFSSNHINYTAMDPEFWDFSYDEMGRYDLPETIDFILNKTNHSQLLCICDSAGNAVFYMMLSDLPQYNDKIIAQVGIAFFYHHKNVSESNSSVDSNSNYTTTYALGPYMDRNWIVDLGIEFSTTIQELNGYSLYDYILYLMYGLRPDHINREIMPSVSANFPAGTSFKASDHLGQLHQSFRHFDYGPAKNLEIYGTTLPTEYNISDIQVPVRIYHAKEDNAATPEEVQYFYDRIPIKAGVIEIADPNFSHMDFLYNEHNNELFNYDVLEFVNDMVNNALKNT
ncbi:lipase 3-like [Planococcus citri]|uniref:lipase 3-like n=1 Tax=Planococcus citri TaxID=170843 RepID=UPI0031F9CD5C